MPAILNQNSNDELIEDRGVDWTRENRRHREGKMGLDREEAED